MGATVSRTKGIPSFVAGRRGKTSLVDAIVRALWVRNGMWPERTFGEITDVVSKERGPTRKEVVRGTVYAKADLFERVLDSDGAVRYRLTRKARS